MPCGRKTMTWKRAMAIARRNYPHLSLARRKKIAGSIIGGLRSKGHIKRRRKR